MTRRATVLLACFAVEVIAPDLGAGVVGAFASFVAVEYAQDRLAGYLSPR